MPIYLGGGVFGVGSHLASAVSPVGEALPKRSGGSLQIERIDTITAATLVGTLRSTVITNVFCVIKNKKSGSNPTPGNLLFQEAW
jgi:hypothetical protein